MIIDISDNRIRTEILRRNLLFVKNIIQVKLGGDSGFPTQ